MNSTFSFADHIPNFNYLNEGNFFLMAGPCVVETDDLVMEVAERIQGMCKKLSIPYIFKASYRKANRSRVDSFTGIGDLKALELLDRVRKELQIPVVTDIHSPGEALLAAQFVDVLQIPAFLCRQTDLLEAAGRSGKVVNIKKGQFVPPWQMKYAAEKVVNAGNSQVMLTERGTMFGYTDYIVDFRSIPEMRHLGFPVVLDVTHSLQQPNSPEGVSGGRPDLIETMARCGIVSGVEGIFIETHPHPEKALSDGKNMLQLDLLEGLLERLIRIHQVTRSF